MRLPCAEHHGKFVLFVLAPRMERSVRLSLTVDGRYNLPLIGVGR